MQTLPATAAPPRPSHARGFTAEQLGAVGELAKLSQRSELVVQLRGGLDGCAIATVRDRWAVEHYRIDPDGVITRALPGARVSQEPPTA